MCDVWGNEYTRHFQLETLASAVVGSMESGQDSFIAPSIMQQLGPSPLVSLKFELVQEGRYQLIFRIRAVNGRKKRGSFGLVVAKNEAECTRTLTREHSHLQWLADRVPNSVVETLRGGFLYLPDRHRREGRGRKIYAYTTRWMSGFYEMNLRRDLNFFVNVHPPKPFSRRDSESIKRRVIEIMLRSFDSTERTCMDVPHIATGDFVVSKPSSGQPQLKLVSCQKLSTRATSERLLHRILSANVKWGKQNFTLAPSDPAEFVQAMHNALGKAESKVWYQRYRAAVKRNRFEGEPAISLTKLDPYFA